MTSKAERKARRERVVVDKAALDQAQKLRDDFIAYVRLLPGPDVTGGRMIPEVAQLVETIDREMSHRSPPRWVLALWGLPAIASAYGVRR